MSLLFRKDNNKRGKAGPLNWERLGGEGVSQTRGEAVPSSHPRGEREREWATEGEGYRESEGEKGFRILQKSKFERGRIGVARKMWEGKKTKDKKNKDKQREKTRTNTKEINPEKAEQIRIAEKSSLLDFRGGKKELCRERRARAIKEGFRKKVCKEREKEVGRHPRRRNERGCPS